MTHYPTKIDICAEIGAKNNGTNCDLNQSQMLEDGNSKEVDEPSEAYAVVRVWKTPHGIPQKISPTSKVGRFCEKKGTKMAAIIKVRAPIIVYRYLVWS